VDLTYSKSFTDNADRNEFDEGVVRIPWPTSGFFLISSSCMDMDNSATLAILTHATQVILK
jgi:hypothetical protein